MVGIVSVLLKLGVVSTFKYYKLLMLIIIMMVICIVNTLIKAIYCNRVS